MLCATAGLVCGGAIAFVVASYGLSAESVELVAFLGVLLVVSLSDIATRTIPDVCLVVAVVVRIAYAVYALAVGAMGTGELVYFVASAFGLVVALAAFVLLADALFKTESMGGGDIKLYGVVALYFGWQVALFVIVVSCLLNVAYALVSWLFAKLAENDGSVLKRSLPFAPSIALACVAAIVLSKTGISLTIAV